MTAMKKRPPNHTTKGLHAAIRALFEARPSQHTITVVQALISTEKHGWTRDDVRVALSELTRRGFLDRVEKGVYRRHSVIPAPTPRAPREPLPPPQGSRLSPAERQRISAVKIAARCQFAPVGQSNPMVFAIELGLMDDPGVAIVRAAFDELVEEGFLKKLEADEYTRATPLVQAAAAPEPVARPAAAPPPAASKAAAYDAWAGSQAVAGTDEWHLRKMPSETIAREVIWRLAAGTLDIFCVAVLEETFAKKVYLEFAQGKRPFIPEKKA